MMNKLYNNWLKIEDKTIIEKLSLMKDDEINKKLQELKAKKGK